MDFIYIFRIFTLFKKRIFIFFFNYFCKINLSIINFLATNKNKKKDKLLPIDSSMTTSQLWFNILPVLASLFTVIINFIEHYFFT